MFYLLCSSQETRRDLAAPSVTSFGQSDWRKYRLGSPQARPTERSSVSLIQIWSIGLSTIQQSNVSTTTQWDILHSKTWKQQYTDLSVWSDTLL